MSQHLVISPALISFFFILALWDVVWKAVAMWKAARNDQLSWFVIVLIFNSAGILPILYIYFLQPRHNTELEKTISKKKKK